MSKKQARDFKKELARIVKFLNADDEQSRMLWSVLTALRGPDTDNMDVKDATTAIIRNAIGLTNTHIAIINFDNDDYRACRNNSEVMNTERYHFKSHAQQAFNILGLKWSDVNSSSPVIQLVQQKVSKNADKQPS